MGKTSKPLKIIFDRRLIQTEDGILIPEAIEIIDKMEEQGHIIKTLDNPDCDYIGADVIIGPTCFRAFDLKYLDMSMAGARKVKYASKKKSDTPKKSN